MILKLQYIAETKNSTLSELHHEADFLGYVIEDGYRKEKVRGETRIPGGRYEIIQRKEGGFFERYKKRFGHSWVPWLKDVPNFKWILIHIGNLIKETDGCLLINSKFYRDENTGDYYGRKSKAAYLDLHALLDGAFSRGERVFIEITRTLPVKEEPAPPIKEDPPQEEVKPIVVVKEKEIPRGCWPFGRRKNLTLTT